MGATGNVGSALVELLRARNVRVHAITREARTWPDGVRGVVGDANDPASLAGAAAGMDGAFLMSGYAAEAQLLADLGAGHAALLSSSSVPLADSGNAIAAYHRDSEEAVKACDAAWTIVRPCSMQSNVTRWKDQLDAGEVIRAPFGDVAVAMTDPADVAAVVATGRGEPSGARNSPVAELTPGGAKRRVCIGTATDRAVASRAFLQWRTSRPRRRRAGRSLRAKAAVGEHRGVW